MRRPKVTRKTSNNKTKNIAQLKSHESLVWRCSTNPQYFVETKISQGNETMWFFLSFFHVEWYSFLSLMLAYSLWLLILQVFLFLLQYNHCFFFFGAKAITSSQVRLYVHRFSVDVYEYIFRCWLRFYMDAPIKFQHKICRNKNLSSA